MDNIDSTVSACAVYPIEYARFLFSFAEIIYPLLRSFPMHLPIYFKVFPLASGDVMSVLVQVNQFWRMHVKSIEAWGHFYKHGLA